MRTIPLSSVAIILLALLPASLRAIPQPHPVHGDEAFDKTLAPQFEISGADPSQANQLPLKSTKVSATISGIIAEVTVEQTYSNTGSAPVEATYVFPASTRAAVHGLDMHIGQRHIKAKIQEKQQAKATFEKAKSENKTASLLEQHRPNVFQMSVANILPGDDIRVVLHYSEKLAPTERIYEFHFPTVVGPRYTSPNAGSPPEAWTQNPHLTPTGAATPTGIFQLELTLNAGMPLQSLQSPSHQPTINFQSKTNASVSLPASSDHANRDFILRYQLADQQVASGVLLHQGKTNEENFFLLNLQPPARILPEQLNPRDYLFIVDVSGSMHGFPLDTSKVLLRELINNLRPTDTFNMVFFSGGSKVLSESPLPANAENLSKAIEMVEQAKARSGTELLPALQKAFSLPRQPGQSRNLVLITDGYVSIEREAFNLVQENLGNANLFTFGIGSSVNRWLIEGLAHAGRGEPFIILKPEEAEASAKRFRDYIQAPVLTDIEVKFEGFQTYQNQPLKVPDVLAERPIQIIGKWKDKPEGRITIRGKAGNVPYEASFDVASEAAKGTGNPALRPLWALDRVRELSIGMEISDQSRGFALNNDSTRGERIAEITTLGLTYQLLTEYTSFVAVDETPRQILTQLDIEQQPQPDSEGNTAQARPAPAPAPIVAAGGKTSSVPEPGPVSLLIIAAAFLTMLRQRRQKH